MLPRVKDDKHTFRNHGEVIRTAGTVGAFFLNLLIAIKLFFF